MDVARARLGALALAAVILVVAAVRLTADDGERPAARPTVALDGAPTAAGAARKPGAPPARGPWVHVAGAVRRPGLYQVGPAARVAEALARAGGPTRRADLTAVNLAAPVEDGQQVVVVVKGAGASPTTPPSGPGSAAANGQGAPGQAGQPVSLSQATVEQLDTLDGIGPTLAARILEFGKAHGGFRSVDQLQEVEGIGPKRFEALREAVRP